MDHHTQEHHPVRNVFTGVSLIVLTAVVLINVSTGTKVYGTQCASKDPGFTCTFVRISLGDTSLPAGFFFTGSFWATLSLLAIPVISAALLTKRAYRGSDS
jgi:hypothetical protein